MDDPTDSSSHSALWLALQELTHRTGVQRDDLLEALAGDLSELRRCWGVNLAQTAATGRFQALKDARTAVNTNLAIHIRKLTPPKRVDRRKYINSVAVCFNMQIDQTHVQLKDKDLSARRNWLADWAPAHLRISVSTSQRYLDHAITQIEQQILAAGYEPTPVPKVDDLPATALALVASDEVIAGTPVPSDDQPPFTPRPILTKRLEDALQAQDDNPTIPRRVFLVGEAGTGKTRFIREHTAANNPVWIDAGADEAMLPGLIDTLTNYGVDVARFDTPRIKHEFKQLLTRTDGPRLVVLDDVPSPAQLDQLVPKSARSRVVVTSRRWPGDKAPVIRVDDLNLEEATAMAAALLPGFNTSDCASLAAAFGCRPLLIEHACRYIREVGVTDIPAYCEGVRQDVAEIIDAAADVADATDRTLTVIYRKYVEQLEQQAPRSVQLLELLTFVGHCNVPAETAMAYLLGVPFITPDLLTRAQVAYDAALKPLLAYSLVSFRPGYGTSMQPLTQHVLRGIFRDRFPAVAERALPLADLRVLGYRALFEAGWHIFSYAGRLTCKDVLIAHARELYLEPGVSPFDGVVGGVQWTLLVEKLWSRNCELSTLIWFLYLTTTIGEDDGSGYMTWLFPGDFKELIDPAQCDQAIQRDELIAVREVIGKLSFRMFTGESVENYGGWNEDGVARFAFTWSEIMARAGRRYEDSPLGTLDLGVFFRDWEERIAQAGTELGGVATPIRSGSAAAERWAAASQEERYEAVRELMLRRQELIETSRRDEKEQVDGDASSAPPAIPQHQEE